MEVDGTTPHMTFFFLYKHVFYFYHVNFRECRSSAKPCLESKVPLQIPEVLNDRHALQREAGRTLSYVFAPVLTAIFVGGISAVTERV